MLWDLDGASCRRFPCLPTRSRLWHRPGRCDIDFSHLDCRSVLILIVALQAIVGESHYLPPCVTTLNYDPEKWYAARQEDVPNETAQSWMNTQTCVENRHGSRNRNYLAIDKVVSFDEIAFFNYVFRPSEKDKPGYSQGKLFKILEKDSEVSREIMEWFIWKYRPAAILIASATVKRYTCARCDLANHPKIKTFMTVHPRRWSRNIGQEVKAFIDQRRGRPDHHA